jgi:hypothetical protein
MTGTDAARTACYETERLRHNMKTHTVVGDFYVMLGHGLDMDWVENDGEMHLVVGLLRIRDRTPYAACQGRY